MLELEAAVERILAALPPAQAERVPLARAHGRILAERIDSPLDLPGFDNSAMDGYAVRAADVAYAGANSPMALRLIGRVAAGEFFSGEVAQGACVRLFTGSAIPRGADAVVMQEDTRTDASGGEKVEFLDSAKPWENIRFRGEDVKSGAVIGETGDKISASLVGLLAAVGLTEISAGRQPIVGLLATGSELIEGGAAFPQRDVLIFLSFVVILATLVVQGLSLPWVIRKLGLAAIANPQEVKPGLGEEMTSR